MSLVKAEFKCKKKFFETKEKVEGENFEFVFNSAKISSFQNLFLEVHLKQVIARRDGLDLGKLQIGIVISTYIEHIWKNI